MSTSFLDNTSTASAESNTQTRYILGVDTSCDETSVAVVANGTHILSSIVRSQQTMHEEHGGIVPEVASRAHLADIVLVTQEALRTAGIDLSHVTAIAATAGPGLGGSLMVGLNMAKSLAYARGLPFLPINHLEGHVYSGWLAAALAGQDLPRFPLLILIVSGGHTDLVLMPAHATYRRLGGTRDDAAGEAFDKVGRLLGLPYPGGPAIERAAREFLSQGGTPVRLPQARLAGTYDFSFSGIKTAVLRLIEPYTIVPDQPENAQQTPLELPDALSVGALAAGFQESVVDILARKTATAAAEHQVAGVIVAGGVAANKALHTRVSAELKDRHIPLFVPPTWLCTDNAAMIAAAGYFQFITAGAQPDAALQADVVPGWSLMS